jgi:hypothetical protein
MNCIADTPCAEIRAQNENVVEAHQPLVKQTTTSSSTTTTTTTIETTTTSIETTSTSNAVTSTTAEQSVEQVLPQDMGMMMSNNDPHPINNGNGCTLHSDCTNQLCGLPHSGFEGVCVDCLFNSHIGCRASEVCILSITAGVPACQEMPIAAEAEIEEDISSSTSTTSVATTPQSFVDTSPQQTSYQNPQDNVYFCGLTFTAITDACLQSKPCPTGIAALECGLEEGCFAHEDCRSQYEAVGSTASMGMGDSMNAFAAFDTLEMRTHDKADGALEDETSFWATTWRNSARSTSCSVSLLTVLLAIGVLFVLL